MNHHFACGKFIPFQSHNVIECITWHCHFHANHMLHFMRARSLSLSHSFSVVAFYSQSLRLFYIFQRKKINLFVKLNAEVCVMNANVSAKHYRMTIFMKYATVATNMTRRGKTSHTRAHPVDAQKYCNNSNDTIGMLFVLNAIFQSKFLQKLHKNSLNWTVRSVGEKNVVICKNENCMYVFCRLVCLHPPSKIESFKWL